MRNLNYFPNHNIGLFAKSVLKSIMKSSGEHFFYFYSANFLLKRKTLQKIFITATIVFCTFYYKIWSSQNPCRLLFNFFTAFTQTHSADVRTLIAVKRDFANDLCITFNLPTNKGTRAYLAATYRKAFTV